MKKYMAWLLSDGLLVQSCFAVCAVIAFIIAAVLAWFSYHYFVIENDFILAAAILTPFAVLVFALGVLWLCVSFLNPEHKWAQAGLKVPLDSGEWIMLILIPVVFIFAAAITTVLKYAGVKGYPIKYYEKLYG